jgi:hypothetical protein
MRAGLLALAIAALATPALADTKPTIDNEHVTVWDLRFAKDAPASAPRDLDTVVVFLEGGAVETSHQGAAPSTATYKFGDAVFFPKGSETRLSGDGAHAIMVALKDAPTAHYANTTGLPLAFPRPGATQMLDNARVTVWSHSWTPDVPSPKHFHDKDVVIAYRYDGAMTSVTADGGSMVSQYKAGEIRFNRGDRGHYEITGAPESAVMVELK